MSEIVQQICQAYARGLEDGKADTRHLRALVARCEDAEREVERLKVVVERLDSVADESTARCLDLQAEVEAYKRGIEDGKSNTHSLSLARCKDAELRMEQLRKQLKACADEHDACIDAAGGLEAGQTLEGRIEWLWREVARQSTESEIGRKRIALLEQQLQLWGEKNNELRQEVERLRNRAPISKDAFTADVLGDFDLAQLVRQMPFCTSLKHDFRGRWVFEWNGEFGHDTSGTPEAALKAARVGVETTEATT